MLNTFCYYIIVKFLISNLNKILIIWFLLRIRCNKQTNNLLPIFAVSLYIISVVLCLPYICSIHILSGFDLIFNYKNQFFALTVYVNRTFFLIVRVKSLFCFKMYGIQIHIKNIFKRQLFTLALNHIQ